MEHRDHLLIKKRSGCIGHGELKCDINANSTGCRCAEKSTQMKPYYLFPDQKTEKKLKIRVKNVLTREEIENLFIHHGQNTHFHLKTRKKESCQIRKVTNRAQSK